MILKIIFRTVIIILAAGLVAGGIYLFAENGGASLLQSANMPGGLPDGDRMRAEGKGLPPGGEFAEGERPARPGSDGAGEGEEFSEGERPARPDMGELPEGEAPSGAGFTRGGHDEGGFSLQGLGGVALQAGKIAIITALVVIVQAIINLIRRRRQQPAKPTTV